MIDWRFSDMPSVTKGEAELSADTLQVTIAVERRTITPTSGDPSLTPIIPGRFTATCAIWWEAGPAQTGCTQR